MREVIERTWPPGGPPADCRQSESPQPFLFLRIYIFSTIPTLGEEPVQWCKLERARWCWDDLDWRCGWTQLKPLYKLLRFWWVDVKNYSSNRYPRKNLKCKLLNLSPINLECSVSLPSLCGACFRFLQWTSEGANQQSQLFCVVLELWATCYALTFLGPKNFWGIHSFL